MRDSPLIIHHKNENLLFAVLPADSGAFPHAPIPFCLPPSQGSGGEEWRAGYRLPDQFLSGKPG